MHAQLQKAPLEEAARHAVGHNVFRIHGQLCRELVMHTEHKPAAQNPIAIEHSDCRMRENKNPFHAVGYPICHRLVVAEQQRHQI